MESRGGGNHMEWKGWKRGGFSDKLHNQSFPLGENDPASVDQVWRLCYSQMLQEADFLIQSQLRNRDSWCMQTAFKLYVLISEQRPANYFKNLMYT